MMRKSIGCIILSILLGAKMVAAATEPAPLIPHQSIPLEAQRMQQILNPNATHLRISHGPLPKGKKLLRSSYKAQSPVIIYPGSLKANIIRIAHFFGWSQVVWTLSYDFHWVGRTRINGNNLPQVLRQLLEDYPLQADFYQGNHVLVIVPRTLQ